MAGGGRRRLHGSHASASPLPTFRTPSADSSGWERHRSSARFARFAHDSDLRAYRHICCARPLRSLWWLMSSVLLHTCARVCDLLHAFDDGGTRTLLSNDLVATSRSVAPLTSLYDDMIGDERVEELAFRWVLVKRKLHLLFARWTAAIWPSPRGLRIRRLPFAVAVFHAGCFSSSLLLAFLHATLGPRGGFRLRRWLRSVRVCSIVSLLSALWAACLEVRHATPRAREAPGDAGRASSPELTVPPAIAADAAVAIPRAHPCLPSRRCSRRRPRHPRRRGRSSCLCSVLPSAVSSDASSLERMLESVQCVSAGTALSNASRNGSRRRNHSSAQRTNGPSNVVRFHMCVDSGTTWHAHNCRDDLINQRPCLDTFTGVDEIQHSCACIGDLPLLVKNKDGRLVRFLLTNVRCVPEYNVSLLSVKQLWRDSGIDTIFKDVCTLVLPDGSALPFAELSSGYNWTVMTRQGLDARPHPSPDIRAKQMKALARSLSNIGIHSARTHSHIDALGSDDAAFRMHRRLHLGVGRIRKLATMTSDAPACLSHAKHAPCHACVEANAAHLPHTTSRGISPHDVPLVHMDVAGPFKTSKRGNNYLLVLVDDRTRFKSVYPVRNKSDVPGKVCLFVSAFNSMADKSSGRVSRIGRVHSDNGGEFMSRQFEEFLADSNIHHTTSPPHVHQLNGVAERSIKSIMDLVRAVRVDSACPMCFWDYLAEHACDVLNRTTCPGKAESSCYECLTGEKPKVMHIMPVGCRAFAVKPSVSKTNIEPKSWKGINLGRNSQSPGAYNVWVPSESRVVVTSDVFFDETFMAWLPQGSERVCPPAPVPVPYVDQPSSLPSPSDTSTHALGDHSTTVLPAAAVDVPSPERGADVPPAPPVSDLITMRSLFQAAHGFHSRCTHSRKVLLLFSGPYDRPDGLAVFLGRMGLEAVQVDYDSANGGDASHDLMNDDFFYSLLQRVQSGEFFAVIASPPCSTFSISRFFAPADPRYEGAPPVRTRDYPFGLPNLAREQRAEVRNANLLLRRCLAVLGTAISIGSEIVLENPADRGDKSKAHTFISEQHCPIWCLPDVQDLLNNCCGRLVTFPYCALGEPKQKYTTLLVSAGLLPALSSLGDLTCTHQKHLEVAGGQRNASGVWNSASAARFPSSLCLLLAQSCAGLLGSIPSIIPSPLRSPVPLPVLATPPTPAAVPSIRPSSLYASSAAASSSRSGFACST